MSRRPVYRFLSYSIAAVWLINGLFCKLLHLVPRHEAIVAAILGQTYAGQLTASIGLAEIGMAAWIISGIWSRLNAWVQIIIIGCMNLLEFLLVPELLLWGRWNLLFALLLMGIIWYNEFRLKMQ
ncbi:hypothetical protein GCM10027051_10920 [Niabella terrae]